MLAGMYVTHDARPFQVNKIANHAMDDGHGGIVPASLYYLNPCDGSPLEFVKVYDDTQAVRLGLEPVRVTLLASCHMCGVQEGWSCKGDDCGTTTEWMARRAQYPPF